LCGDNSTLTQSAMKELKVRLLEEGLSGPLRVGRVGYDDIELVLVIVKELEAIADVDLDLGVAVSDGHIGEVLLGEADDSLV